MTLAEFKLHPTEEKEHAPARPTYTMRYIAGVLWASGLGTAILGGAGWIWTIVAAIAGVWLWWNQKSPFMQLIEKTGLHRQRLLAGEIYYQLKLEDEAAEIYVESLGDAEKLAKIIEHNNVRPWLRAHERGWTTRKLSMFEIMRWENVSIPTRKFGWSWEERAWKELWSAVTANSQILIEQSRASRAVAAVVAPTDPTHPWM